MEKDDMTAELIKHIESANEEELRALVKHANARLAIIKRGQSKSKAKAMIGKHFREASQTFFAGTASGRYVEVLSVKFPDVLIKWFQRSPNGSLHFCPTDTMLITQIDSHNYIEIPAEEFKSALKHMSENAKLMA